MIFFTLKVRELEKEELAPMLKEILVGLDGKGENTNQAKPRECCKISNLLHRAKIKPTLTPTKNASLSALGHFFYLQDR